MSVVLMIAAGAVILYALHRCALHAEGRGWIYYVRRTPERSALGNAFLEVQTLLEPGKRLLIEAARDDDLVQDDCGDPPETQWRWPSAAAKPDRCDEAGGGPT